jgi:hypothetical protein
VLLENVLSLFQKSWAGNKFIKQNLLLETKFKKIVGQKDKNNFFSSIRNFFALSSGINWGDFEKY